MGAGTAELLTRDVQHFEPPSVPIVNLFGRFPPLWKISDVRELDRFAREDAEGATRKDGPGLAHQPEPQSEPGAGRAVRLRRPH
jgi:hypothetical protein